MKPDCEQGAPGQVQDFFLDNSVSWDICQRGGVLNCQLECHFYSVGCHIWTGCLSIEQGAYGRECLSIEQGY